MFTIKSAAITGGSGALCGVMAEAMAEQGAQVAIIGRSLDKARVRAEAIKAKGGRALAISADVTDRDHLQKAADVIKSEFGGLDALINGAGGNRPDATTSDENSFFDLPLEAVRAVFEANCLGTILPSQVLGRLILDTAISEGREGHIINIGSMSGERPLTRVAAYSAAKAAVHNFTRWLAVHMAENYSPKLRVNAIAPGFFLTEQNRFLLTEEGGGYTERGGTIVAHTPARRLGEAGDLVSALLWLLDPASRFVTGVVVPVDGGFSAFGGV